MLTGVAFELATRASKRAFVASGHHHTQAAGEQLSAGLETEAAVRAGHERHADPALRHPATARAVSRTA